jgi:hypothetical protein
MENRISCHVGASYWPLSLSLSLSLGSDAMRHLTSSSLRSSHTVLHTTRVFRKYLIHTCMHSPSYLLYQSLARLKAHTVCPALHARLHYLGKPNDIALRL